MKNDEQRDYLLKILGDEDAVDAMQSLGAISQAWDDAIDEGAAFGVDQALLHAMIHLPRNPFWQRYSAELQPLVETAILDWRASCGIERAMRRSKQPTQRETALAYVLRDQLAGVVVFSARILRGWEYAESVAEDVRRFLHSDESPETYEQEVLS